MKKYILSIFLFLLVFSLVFHLILIISNPNTQENNIFDEETVVKGEVTINDQDYILKKTENSLGYGGVDIYNRSDQTRVIEEEKAEKIIKKYSWSETIEEDHINVTQIENIIEDIENLQSYTEVPVKLTDSANDFISELEDIEVPGTGVIGEPQSAWEFSTTVSTTLNVFDTTINLVESSLGDLNDESEQTIEDLETVKSSINSKDVRNLEKNLNETKKSLSEIDETVVLLKNIFGSMSNSSEEIASDFSETPFIGDKIQSFFLQFSSEAGEVEDNFKDFSQDINNMENSIDEVKEKQTSREEKITISWEKRQNYLQNFTILTSLLIFLLSLSFIVFVVYLYIERKDKDIKNILFNT